jgi:hypothetical protein
LAVVLVLFDSGQQPSAPEPVSTSTSVPAPAPLSSPAPPTPVPPEQIDKGPGGKKRHGPPGNPKRPRGGDDDD